MIPGRPQPTLFLSPLNLGETILETPARVWRWRPRGSRNTRGRATKPGPPPSAPGLNQAFTSNEPPSRPNSCPWAHPRPGMPKRAL